ncbi:unnamed protein product [Brachionus calyciflorus]|uniref:C2H2-type domain-containing protein n=1 Tax=Brachionus calyciflorus TaxID=104777 RepID=A0A814GNM7_9BILA|nr:unnamed protein product [Brachionus calyciflorus]
MERRLAIYERIKDTKLNKLTVKQGNVNVKLNLKKDLIDPNVEISDKALEMLEVYIEKNVNISQSSTNETNSINQKIETPTTEKEINCNNDNKNNTELESPKKVKFIIPEIPKIESINKNLLIEQLNQPTESLHTISPLENTNLTSNENQTHSESSSKIEKKELKCRLCKLKISSDRALHEHVSRIHGGKGAFSISKKENTKNSTEIADEDYESSDSDDLESQDENYFSSSSDSKRFKIDKPTLPRPNVAIRVAKVAYYNSKGTINSQNPFKSGIFKNGGIRGNFFSQERLPLRSCKIKMKITSSNIKNFENPDDFLINVHEIIKTDYCDSNKTTSFQSSSIKDQYKDELIINENEIKLFFKSLLDYIPLNNILRLDDLIKKYELELSKLEADYQINTFESIRYIYETVLNSKQLGINLYNLNLETNKQLVKDNLSQIKLSVLNKLLDLLVINHLILKVGVVDRVYVAHEFKKHWVIESYKNQRGRGFFGDEYDDNDSEFSKDDKQESEYIDREEDLSNSDSRPMRSTTMHKEPITKNSKNFKPICIIPRPWRYIDGILNRPVLKKMLESIILYLKSNPNVSFNSISSHFCPVLQPIMTLELLEMLERLKCVKKITLKKENSCDLFSDFNNGSYKITDDDGIQGNELHNYYLNQSSIFNIKKVFPN